MKNTLISSSFAIILLLNLCCISAFAEDELVFEQDGITIYMLDFTQDSHNWGQLKYKIENNRSDKCTITHTNTYLNGNAVGVDKNILLIPGQDKIIETIDIDLEYLSFWGDKVLETVALSFSVMDEYYNVIIEAMPEFEIKDFTPVDPEASDLDIPLLNNNGVNMTILGYKQDDQNFVLYYKYNNSTENYIVLSPDYEISGSKGSYSMSLSPNTTLIGSVVLSPKNQSEIRLPGIMTIEIDGKENNGYSGHILFPLK